MGGDIQAGSISDDLLGREGLQFVVGKRKCQRKSALQLLERGACSVAAILPRVGTEDGQLATIQADLALVGPAGASDAVGIV